MPDYASIYDSYWSSPDRWGQSSLRELGETVESILETCGPGRLLDAGSGMGHLVHALLRQGIDAHGLDVAQRCVDHANALTPGRFTQGSLLDMPFADASFDTVVCTDVLEHIAESDVPRVIAQLARIARRSLFIRVATTPDRDGSWHLTVRDRAWWERQFLEAGLRRHPLLLTAVPFESMEHEGWQATLVLEKIPATALARYPLASLKAQRNLHMDMLREPGRRSDAHLARYQLACQFVRPGDRVLDAACGLGYGSAIIAAGSSARSVTGLDESASAIDYAIANHGSDEASRDNPITFHQGDAQDLSRFGDESFDTLVSFETLEHLPDPDRFLDEARRVLKPGGRILLSIPNQWTDETGNDPNPHHLHVYDWSRLAGEVGSRFIIEKRYAQVAGGGMKHRDGVRLLREAPVVAIAAPPEAPADVASANTGSVSELSSEPLSAPDSETAPLASSSTQQLPDAEWWLVVAMKQPVGAFRDSFTETTYPDHTANPAHHVSAFARDYQNPWLVRAMVALGLRCTNKHALHDMARAIIDAAASSDASPDLGAALCVLGYRLLDAPALARDEADGLLARLGVYEAGVTSLGTHAAPHSHRWVISNAYMGGQILLATGRRVEARAAFRRCAAMDVLAFSPLLASKTIDASYHAGLIAACDGDSDGAVADFRRGLSELTRVLGAGDWSNIIGSIEEPLTFGLVDLQQGVELASRCAFAIDALPLLPGRPGHAWTLLHRRALADVKKWAEQQSASIEWLRAQRRDYEASLADARAWIARQDEAKAWLEEQSERLTARVEAVTRESSDERARQRAALAEKSESNQRLLSRRDELEARLEERDQTIAQLREFIEARKSAEQWLLTQKRELETRLTERDARIADLQGKIAKLIEGREWLLSRQLQARAPSIKSPPAP